MKLMKLSAGSVRLRRMAKAHAAGEFTQGEYRAARRLLIENFSSLPEEDDTQPRAEILTRSVAPSPGADDLRPLVVAQPKQLVWVRRTLLALGLLMCVAIAAQALGEVRELTSTIPPVVDRDPNPTTSRRLLVNEFSVQIDHVLADVSAAEVSAQLSRALDAVRERHAERDHGFTDLELVEVGRLLQALGIHQEDRLPPGAAQDIEALVAEQKKRRGVSVAELEEIASSLQRFYRDKGYLLATVILPAQDVVDGRVQVRVLPGVLGTVAVTGGDANLVTSRFTGALGQPVTNELIETRLFEINALPGLQTQASFVTGDQEGETQLNLEVIEQQDWSAAVQLDNHGDDATGEERLSAVISWLNPRGRGDQLNFGGLTTLSPTDQQYYFVDYDSPIYRGYDFSLYAANND